MAVLVALVAVIALLGTGSPASARPAQDPTFTTATVATTTTTVPGAPAAAGTGTNGDGTTTTSTTESTPASSSRILTESRKIMAIVGGLVLIALALTLLTIRYWRQTKPVPVAAPEPARRAEPELTRAERRALEAAKADEGGRRGSRRAVAGADHAGADDDWEPRGTGEHERVVIEPTGTGTGRPSRPSRAGREAALRRDVPSS